MLTLIEKSLLEIVHRIRTIPEVRKLLYYNTLDPLNQPDVSLEEIKPYITLSPVYEVSNLEPFDRNNFIMVKFEEGEILDDDSINSLFRIDVLCENKQWEIEGGMVRPLRIASLIAKHLDKQKFSSSHKLYFAKVQHALFNRDITGYTVLMTMYESGGELEDGF